MPSAPPDMPIETPEAAAEPVAPGLDGGALQALLELGRAVQEEEIDLERVLGLVVRRTSELLDADIAWVALLAEGGKAVQVVKSWGHSLPEFDSMAVDVGDGIGGVAVRERETIVIDDYAAYGAHSPEVVEQTMHREGVRTVVCAPMLRGETTVGALYAANRSRTLFRSEHVALLSTLATQASSAIRHAQSYKELGRRNVLLERSFRVHRELTAVSLRETGLDGLSHALARLVGTPLVVEQEVVAPCRRRYEVGRPAAGEERFAVPIAAGEKSLGQILFCGREPTALQKLTLDHGATLIALELLKQRAARDVEWRLRGELLEELLESAGPPSVLAERAERLGVELGRPRRILALESRGGRIGYGELLAIVRSRAGRRLHGSGGSVLAVKRGGKVLLAIAETEVGLEAAIVEDVRAALAERSAVLQVGVSGLTTDLAAARQEAEACLRLAHQAPGEVVVRADDLGPLQFVLAGADVEGAREMVRRQLRPLLEHDAEAKAPLLPTLRAYLDADGHQARAAASCYIHVSTLKYRLKRIRELIDGDLADPEVAFQLRLAFKLMDMLAALGVEAKLT